MFCNGPLESIIVVGGGSSGWITAALLRKHLGPRCPITVIESPAIGRIGVGEATVPSIKEEVFDFLGIPEREWMPRCEASFKLGIKYVDWAHPPGSSTPNSFYHLFGEVENLDGIPLTHYWLHERLRGAEQTLAHAAYTAAYVCDANRSPRYLDGAQAEHCAYHFDAHLVADYLRDWSVAHGVRHVAAQVVEVMRDERGWVSGVRTDNGQKHAADLFIDCSGFRGLLLTQALHEPFQSFNDKLLCDRAVATGLPYSDAERQTHPYTTATALSAGWVWDIPLRHRSGTGYVYSSAHLTPEEAEAEFRAHLGPRSAECKFIHLRMRTGRSNRAWVNNVVAIGLAYGFIEPLESTGIYMMYAAVHQLLRHFPGKDMDVRLQSKFNERVAFMVDDIRDFVVMHYATTSRTDTPFWRRCKYELPISDSLQEALDLYRAGVPIRESYSGNMLYKQFDASYDRFWTNSNYLAVLSGMGWLPEKPHPLLAYRDDSVRLAERRFAEIQAEGQRRARLLPSIREYLFSVNGEPPAISPAASNASLQPAGGVEILA